MEKKSNSKEEKITISKNEEINADFSEKMFINIFCPLCYLFPEYSIKLLSSSDFNLVHEYMMEK